MRIGVIDTTGNFTDEFFKEKALKIVNSNKNIGELENWGFKYSHSEYVCSMIYKENPKAEILLICAVGKFEKYPVDSIVSSIYLLVRRNAKIINISLGQEVTYDKKLLTACKYAEEKGVIIVASHANKNSKKAFPASFNNVIGVLSEKNKSNSMYTYDSKYNNIIVNIEYPFVSYIFLNQISLMNGNSFLTAKITGFISRYLDGNKIDIKNIVQKLNLDIPIRYPDIRYKVDFIISDRVLSIEQIEYSKLYDNCRGIYNIYDYYINIYKHNYQRKCVILIDYFDYKLFIRHRKLIEDLAKLNRYNCAIKEIILRYPYYSTYDLILLNREMVCFNHYLV